VPLEIVRNNITEMKVDAIVNSANPDVAIGYGVDGDIHAAAGSKLFEARKEIGKIPVGSAVATPAFNLNAKYVIHTVGPVWFGGSDNEMDLVEDCYKNSLQIAVEMKCKSIAFPLISTGAYGFPKSEALQIATSVISNFLLFHEIKVFLVVYDPKSFALSEKLFESVTSFIDDKYTGEHNECYSENITNEEIESREFLISHSIRDKRKLQRAPYQRLHTKSKRSLYDLMNELDDTFSQSLLRLIREKGKTESQVYKKANVDRKLFSKIRTNVNYKPSKITAISFAIALELNLDETKDFIARAGFALSHSSKFDVIIEYFIEQQNYNVFEINEVLFAFDQNLLGF